MSNLRKGKEERKDGWTDGQASFVCVCVYKQKELKEVVGSSGRPFGSAQRRFQQRKDFSQRQPDTVFILE